METESGCSEAWYRACLGCARHQPFPRSLLSSKAPSDGPLTHLGLGCREAWYRACLGCARHQPFPRSLLSSKAPSDGPLTHLGLVGLVTAWLSPLFEETLCNGLDRRPSALQILGGVVGRHLLAGVTEAVLPVQWAHAVPVCLRCKIAPEGVPT